MAKYTAIFEQAADGTWGGYFPDIRGLYVNGATLSEVKANAQSGLEFWMEEMKADGLEMPAPGVQVAEFEVAA